MPQSQFTVKATRGWEPEEPTGEECVACGERCYLNQNRLIVRIGEIKIEKDIVICDSCISILDAE